jgi:hypothetical protein
MNERIKELAVQAGMEDFPIQGVNTLYGHEEIKKFAHLLVNKCAMIGNYAHDGGEYPGPMIKEYFGVE